jgi:hypothetical protein
MPYGRVTYFPAPSTTQFAVNFPFISRTHVSVTVDGAPATFTWINDSLINITSLAAGAIVGKRVQIRRSTQPSARVVDYPPSGLLAEEILDGDSLQAFYLAQEAADDAEDLRAYVDGLSFAGGVVPVASSIGFSPAGGVSSLTVQAAITELGTGKAPLSSPSFTGPVAVNPDGGGLGSLRVFGSDPNFNAGGPSSFMDLSGTTTRIGYRHGGGSGGSVGIYSGTSALTAWASVDRRFFVGGFTAPVWDERFLAVHPGSSDNSLLIGAYTSNASYTGTMARFQTETAPGTGWNFVQYRSAGGTDQHVVRGDGAIFERGNRVYSGRSWIEPAVQPYDGGNKAFVFPHGLTAKPVEYRAFLRCVQAEAGWQPGDEIPIENVSTNSACITVGVDGTNIVVSGAGTISIAGKTGAPYTAITVAASPSHRWAVGVRYQPL